MKAWPVLAISIVQSFLCLAHWFLYRTWIDFWWPMSPTAAHALQIAFIVLSFVFMTATLLGFRSSNPVVRIFYKAAALWLGLANFLFVGAMIAWLVDLLLRILVPAATRIAARPYLAAVASLSRNRDRRVWPRECPEYPLATGHRAVDRLAGELARAAGAAGERSASGARQRARVRAADCADGPRLEPRSRLSSRRHV